MFGIEIAIALISVLIGVMGTYISFEKRIDEKREQFQKKLEEEKLAYTEKELKSYAAQRDFSHLQRNYEQLKQGQILIQEDIEEKFNKIEEKLLELDKKMLVCFPNKE